MENPKYTTIKELCTAIQNKEVDKDDMMLVINLNDIVIYNVEDEDVLIIPKDLAFKTLVDMFDLFLNIKPF